MIVQLTSYIFIYIILAFIIILPAFLQAGEIYRSINDLVHVKDHYMDLKTFAYLFIFAFISS